MVVSVRRRRRTHRSRASIRTRRRRPASSGLLPRTFRSPEPSLPRLPRWSESPRGIRCGTGERCAKVLRLGGRKYSGAIFADPAASAATDISGSTITIRGACLLDPRSTDPTDRLILALGAIPLLLLGGWYAVPYAGPQLPVPRSGPL